MSDATAASAVPAAVGALHEQMTSDIDRIVNYCSTNHGWQRWGPRQLAEAIVALAQNVDEAPAIHGRGVNPGARAGPAVDKWERQVSDTQGILEAYFWRPSHGSWEPSLSSAEATAAAAAGGHAAGATGGSSPPRAPRSTDERRSVGSGTPGRRTMNGDESGGRSSPQTRPSTAPSTRVGLPPRTPTLSAYDRPDVPKLDMGAVQSPETHSKRAKRRGSGQRSRSGHGTRNGRGRPVSAPATRAQSRSTGPAKRDHQADSGDEHYSDASFEDDGLAEGAPDDAQGVPTRSSGAAAVTVARAVDGEDSVAPAPNPKAQALLRSIRPTSAHPASRRKKPAKVVFGPRPVGSPPKSKRMLAQQAAAEVSSRTGSIGRRSRRAARPSSAAPVVGRRDIGDGTTSGAVMDTPGHAKHRERSTSFRGSAKKRPSTAGPATSSKGQGALNWPSVPLFLASQARQLREHAEHDELTSALEERQVSFAHPTIVEAKRTLRSALKKCRLEMSRRSQSLHKKLTRKLEELDKLVKDGTHPSIARAAEQIRLRRRMRGAQKAAMYVAGEREFEDATLRELQTKVSMQIQADRESLEEQLRQLVELREAFEEDPTELLEKLADTHEASVMTHKEHMKLLERLGETSSLLQGRLMALERVGIAAMYDMVVVNDDTVRQTDFAAAVTVAAAKGANTPAKVVKAKKAALETPFGAELGTASLRGIAYNDIHNMFDDERRRSRAPRRKSRVKSPHRSRRRVQRGGSGFLGARGLRGEKTPGTRGGKRATRRVQSAGALRKRKPGPAAGHGRPVGQTGQPKREEHKHSSKPHVQTTPSSAPRQRMQGSEAAKAPDDGSVKSNDSDVAADGLRRVENEDSLCISDGEAASGEAANPVLAGFSREQLARELERRDKEERRRRFHAFGSTTPHGRRRVFSG